MNGCELVYGAIDTRKIQKNVAEIAQAAKVEPIKNSSEGIIPEMEI